MKGHYHPGDETLASYIDGTGLSLAERHRVEEHLARCPRCVAVVAKTVRTTTEIAKGVPDKWRD